jgi:SagB-type dehydrogenase family enzyme
MGGRADLLIAYHERTKHHVTRYAAGPRGLDWLNQPDPFRTFEGAPRHSWTPAARFLPVPFDALFEPGAVSPRPFDSEGAGLLFELSLGLAAWKSQGGATWALRCNPSSGNLHPTEGYLVCPSLPGLARGVHHYLSLRHCLERRAAPGAEWDRAFQRGGFLAGLSSVHWREAWKYGERAFRYCQHDVGHALAGLAFAAAALGWRVRLLDGGSDEEVAALLGLDRGEDFEGAEPEAPQALAWVSLPGVEPPEPEALLASLRGASWTGRASRLSARRVEWEALREAQEASRKPKTAPLPPPGFPPAPSPVLREGPGPSAAQIIRQRRSAVAYDGRTPMSSRDLYGILDRTLPREGAPPFALFPWAPRIHLLLFIHRVEGLERGLYLLPRSDEGEFALRAALGDSWRWRLAPGCPGRLRLFLLAEEDVREMAMLISCHQDIASDSCFSLGMLARFEASLEEGPWWYRWLFWEAGAVGQALYLGAERAGFRGTGIGCFFDDEVHRLLGLRGRAFQSLYHFTVGSPLDDPRIQTLPPYE